MFETAFDPLGGLGVLISGLAELDQDVSDRVRVDRLRAMEEAKSALAAAQAREAVAFAASQRAQQLIAGEPLDRAERGVAAQIGLALRISPSRARRYLGWARVLTAELQHTFAALKAGTTTERRAMIVARETVWLSREHRAVVDAELAALLPRLGDRRVEAEVKTRAYRLDPAGFVERARAAERDRRVFLRPAPDAMARLTALLPVAQGVAAYASLCRTADSTLSAGDARGRGQIMADTLVERVTGQSTATAVPVEVNLVMTDRSLFAPEAPGGDEPALVDGTEPIPAEIARELALDASDSVPIWLRRLYRAPTTGGLVAMDSSRREFTPAQRRFLRLRDRYCRTPWCEAPVRHADHVVAVGFGGLTDVDNGQGYCEACNYAKQAPGWRARVTARAAPHEVTITSPTGHRYRSRAPDPPRAA